MQTPREKDNRKRAMLSSLKHASKARSIDALKQEDDVVVRVQRVGLGDVGQRGIEVRSRQVGEKAERSFLRTVGRILWHGPLT